MVLISRMQLNEQMRQEMLWREVQQARMAEEAARGTIKAAGAPNVQPPFSLHRFGQLVRRLKLHSA